MLRRKLYKVICASLLFSMTSIIPSNAQILYKSVDEFVNESYKILLDRESEDDTGIEHWSYLIKNHGESLYNYITSLIAGEEFLSKEMSDEEFLTRIYKLFLGRDPQEEEKNYWIGRIQEENSKLNDIKKARVEVCKVMFNEKFFNEFSYGIGATPKFENLNNYGIEVLRKDYDPKYIDYVDTIYSPFGEIGQDLYYQSTENLGEEKNLDKLIQTLPIFSQNSDNKEYEEIKKVKGENIERLVYALDYKIEIPHEQSKAVYISPFLQMNASEKGDFVTLGLSVTSRRLGKEVTNADLLLGESIVDLDAIYNDYSKYDEKGLSVYEFEIKIRELKDLENLDRILNSDLSKIRLTFDGDKTYIYNLYDKDRVRNTLKYMASIYSQILIPYLFYKQESFNRIIEETLR